MAKGGGTAPGGAKTGLGAGPATGNKPFVATPGREEVRAAQQDVPPRAAEQLMTRQDQATAHPGTSPGQPRGPAQVTSTGWVEEDRQMRLAQAVSRSQAGPGISLPGGTDTQPGPTLSEAQAIDAMRARFNAAWGITGETAYAGGVETRLGRFRAWTAELPARAKGRDEEREP